MPNTLTAGTVDVGAQDERKTLQFYTHTYLLAAVSFIFNVKTVGWLIMWVCYVQKSFWPFVNSSAVVQ